MNLVPQDLIDYWIGVACFERDYLESKNKLWFFKNPTTDHYIIDHFSFLFAEFEKGNLSLWEENQQGRLALIILLDQFSRNAYRGTPKMYQYDTRALEISLKTQKRNDFNTYHTMEKILFFLVLEHAENLEYQNASCLFFKNQIELVPSEVRDIFELHYDYALKHQVIIKRFGRFPHRNEILGRISTAQEKEFLKGPHSSF